jgi:hypothetical protein
MTGANTPLWQTIPELTQSALRLYFEQRIQPGSFVTALLENDGLWAVRIADEDNYEAIPSILRWLAQYAPGGSFGSRAKVEQWLAQGQENAA